MTEDMLPWGRLVCASDCRDTGCERHHSHAKPKDDTQAWAPLHLDCNFYQPGDDRETSRPSRR